MREIEEIENEIQFDEKNAKCRKWNEARPPIRISLQFALKSKNQKRKTEYVRRGDDDPNAKLGENFHLQPL